MVPVRIQICYGITPGYGCINHHTVHPETLILHDKKWHVVVQEAVLVQH